MRKQTGKARYLVPFVVWALLALALPTPSVHSQGLAGSWSITMDGRFSEAISGETWAISLSSSAALTSSANGQVSGSGSFSETVNWTYSDPRCGAFSGSVPVSGSVSVSGQILNATSGLATLTLSMSMTSSGGTSVGCEVTTSCYNGTCTTSTTTFSQPLPDVTKALGQTMQTYLTGSYTKTVPAPSPAVGSTTISVRGTTLTPGAGQTTSSESSSQSASSSATTSTDCRVVNPSAHIDICVPAWLSGSTSGGATVVAPGGAQQNFAGKLPIGSTLQTGPSSYATVSDNAATVSVGPDSQVTYNACTLDAGALDCGQNSAVKDFTGKLVDALHSALHGRPFGAMFTLAKGEYHFFINDLNAVQNEVDFSMYPNGALIDETGSEATASVSGNGTQIDVISGVWEAVSLVSGQAVNVTAGEQLFVPSSAALATGQNMSGSVQALNTSSVNQWWNSQSGSQNTDLGAILGGLGLIAVLVVGASLAVVRVRRRGSRSRGGQQLYAPSQVTGVVCPSCGRPVSASDEFCGECGASLPKELRCLACGAPNLPDAVFCAECGAGMGSPSRDQPQTEPEYCTNCGEELAADAKFCLKCGARA